MSVRTRQPAGEWIKKIHKSCIIYHNTDLLITLRVTSIYELRGDEQAEQSLLEIVRRL